MTLRVRIEKEVSQRIDWSGYRDLLADVLLAAGFTAAPALVYSRFDADLFHNPVRLVDLVVAAGEISDAEALQQLYSSANMQAVGDPEFLKSVLLIADSLSAAPALPRLAGSNLAYALGDSRTAQNVDNTYHYSWRGSGATNARKLLNGRLTLPIANINGGSGETAATIRSTRYPTAKASSAKVLILLAGINQGTSLAQDIADVTYMCEDWVGSASDRIVAVLDEHPGGTQAGWNSTRIERHADLRDAIRLLHDPTAGIYVVPSWDAIAAAPDGDEPAAGMLVSADIHPAIPGGVALGLALTSVLDPLLPDYSPYDDAAFVTGTGLNGGNFAGVTGNAISVAGLTSGSVASSRMVVDGDTTWAELTLNTTSQASVNLSAGTLPGEVTPGTTKLASMLMVKVHAGLAHCRQIQLKQIRQSGNDIGSNAGTDSRHPGTIYEYGLIAFSDSEDTILLLRTPPTTVDAAATQVRWQLILTPERIGGVDQTMAGLVSIAFPGMMVE